MLNRAERLLRLDIRYFLSGGFWLTFSTIGGALGGIFISALFARFWPADVFGQFSFINASVAFLTVTALPGMGQALTQSVAEGRDGTYRKAFKVVLRWSALGSIIFILGSVYFLVKGNYSMSVSGLIAGLSFPALTGFNLYGSFLTGKKYFKKVALYSLTAQYFSIIWTAFALWKYPQLEIVVLFSLLSTASINIFLTLLTFRLVNNSKTNVNYINLGKKLSLSQWLSIAADYVDRFLIPLMLGFIANATWSFAIIIPTQMHNFFKIFITLGQPKISTLSNKQIADSLNKKATFFLLITIIFIVVYIASAPHIFKILYPGYEASVLPSQLFSLSLLYFPGNLFGLALVKKRRTDLILRVNFLYFVSTILTAIVLIPFFGLAGAVCSKLISRCMLGLCQVFSLRASLNDR